ncbi:hypothetical protein [Streptomyces sp. NPDC056660]|uniref:hypothetical protein n=1 Tax=Streptomyces sp. NPDC056660 TaxID=3345897 RepID=UPI0036877BB1
MRIRRTPLILAIGLSTVVMAACAADLAVGSTAQQRVARAVDCRLKPTGPVTAPIGLPVTVAATSDSLTITPTNVSMFGQAISVSALSSVPSACTGLVLQLAIPHTTSLSKAPAVPADTRCSHTKA